MGMINILPQPGQMFEFAARPSYFRKTTCSCDFLAQKLILQIWQKWKWASNQYTALNNKGISICRISTLRQQHFDKEDTEPIKRC